MIDMTDWNFEQRLDYLTKLSCDDWENICRGCGVCCLVKVRSGGKTFFTKMACDELDLKTRRCNCYNERFVKHAGCANVDVETVRGGNLLPANCAYSEILFDVSIIQPTVRWDEIKHEKDIGADTTAKLLKQIIPESAYWGIK